MKKDYWILERNVLILIAIPLPIFSFAYLYTSSDNMELAIPSLPEAWWPILLAGILALLTVSFTSFNIGIAKLRQPDMPLEIKLQKYRKMTIKRFWQLLVSGILCAIGLLVYENAGFTVAYAITLVLVSLGKPTPDRIIRLMRLKGEQRQIVEDFKRRE